DVDDLPPELAELPAASPSTSDNGRASHAASSEAPSPDGEGRVRFPPEAGPTSLVGRPLDDIEQWAIEQTLQLTGGNREETARILGIGARTLYRKLEKYGL